MKKPLMGEFDTVKLDGRRTSKPAIRPLAHYGLLFILFYLRVSILILNYAFQYDESDRRIRFAYVQLTGERQDVSISCNQRSLEDILCVCTIFLTSNSLGHPAEIQPSTRSRKTAVPFRLWDLAIPVSLERISFL